MLVLFIRYSRRLQLHNKRAFSDHACSLCGVHRLRNTVHVICECDPYDTRTALQDAAVFSVRRSSEGRCTVSSLLCSLLCRFVYDLLFTEMK